MMLLLSLSLSKTAWGAQWIWTRETPESLAAPVVYDACRLGGKKRRLVTVQDCPWKFVSPQLLDYKGTEIMYPVEDDRDRWWAGG
jgi:hypothetical protein